MGPVLSSIKGFKKEEKQKDSRYQTYRPLIHVIRIQIKVEATNIPETYFECGKLEIKFEQQIPYTNDLQNKVAIRLRSSECNVFRDCFFENPWRKDIMIEFRLMNTDKLWETTIESQWFRMGQKTTTHKVEFPCGPTFEVTIRLVGLSAEEEGNKSEDGFWFFHSFRGEECSDRNKREREAQYRDMEERDREGQNRYMEERDRNKMGMYQLFQHIEEIVLALKVNGSENNHFNVFNPAILEISYRQANLRHSENLMTISLTSPTCLKEKRICKDHWKGDLVFCLKYTDHNWTFREIRKENAIQDDVIRLTFDMPYINGLVYTAKFTIEMNLTTGTTDIKYQTQPLLSHKEDVHFHVRRQLVLIDMQHRNSDAEDVTEVPTIAIIGSGGGIRAAIGMSGALTELEHIGILDLAMYTAGVSGSAWYLLTLYADTNSGSKLYPVKVSERIRGNLNNFGKFKMAWNIVKYYIERILCIHGKYFTATNVFGKMIGRLLLKAKGTPKWSQLGSVFTPLPLVAALHIRDETKIRDYHEWIEISPFWVYIPKYGTAINMVDFGSEFHNGILTTRYEEPPIHYLQGVCGSAYGIVRENRPEDHRNQGDRFQLNVQEAAWYNPMRYVRYAAWKLCVLFQNVVWKLFNIFDAFFLAKVPNFLLGTQLRSIVDENDKIDFDKDYMMLVDAGLSFNSPYPLVLHPCRRVDLIISFDWSDRREDAYWPFGELEKAEQWAHIRRVPFPRLQPQLDMIKIDWKNKIYREVYVFPGNDTAPTIVHFVMINESFRGQDNFNILPAYKTLRFGYSEGDFNRLTNLVRHNVNQNRNLIIGCIQDQVARKREINRRRDAV